MTATDAAEAVATATRHAPHIIIADLRLREGASGIDAIKAVRAAQSTPLPALIITGDTSAAVLKLTHACGFFTLHKPVPPIRLRAALSQLLTVAAR